MMQVRVLSGASSHEENKKVARKVFYMNGLLSKIKGFLLIAKKLILRGKDLMMKNKIVTAFMGIGVLALVIVLVVIFKGTSTKSEETQAKATTVSGSDVSEEPLEENAYPEVNELVKNYYKALADGDMDAIVANRNYTEDTEKIRLEKKSEYIDSYENITCYTKKGLLENTYLAYVYYEVKFKDIDTLAPALNTLYICPNESGKLYIYEGEIDDNVSAYLKSLSTQDDVLDLFNRVQVSYNEAIEKDENLNAFLTELPTKIKTEVGEALAALEAPESTTEETTEEEATGEAAEEVTTEEAPQPAEETVEATETVNVRSSDSETADKIGKAQSGDLFTRLETKENGWSKIKFEDREAYVKSEFLKVVDTAAGAENTNTENTDGEGVDTAETATQGKVTVKETVNVRKSANEASAKLGVAYQGDHFDLIMKQADGWSKINYNGQTGYVKSEFLE